MKSAWRKMWRSIFMPAGKPAWMSSSVRSSAVGQFQRVGAGLLLDAENHRRLAVVRADAALGCGADADFGDMADQHGLTVAQGHHRLGNVVEHVDAALALDQVFLRRFDVEAGRGVLVRVAQRLADFIQRQAVGGQALGLDGHLELLGVAADGQDFGDAGHGQDAPLQDLLGGVLQFHAANAFRSGSAMNRISPMIEEAGAIAGAGLSGGRAARASCSRSATTWRAR